MELKIVSVGFQDGHPPRHLCAALILQCHIVKLKQISEQKQPLPIYMHMHPQEICSLKRGQTLPPATMQSICDSQNESNLDPHSSGLLSDSHTVLLKPFHRVVIRDNNNCSTVHNGKPSIKYVLICFQVASCIPCRKDQMMCRPVWGQSNSAREAAHEDKEHLFSILITFSGFSVETVGNAASKDWWLGGLHYTVTCPFGSKLTTNGFHA